MKIEPRRHRLRHRARPLDVWVAGEGPPLALLHGWGLSGRAYRAAMISLAETGYRVVAPSLAITEDWTIERAAETAAEALAGVDGAPTAVVGHSFGGTIGSQLALDHPDFVTALVAIDSPLVSLGRVRMGRIALPGSHYRIVLHAPAALALLSVVGARGGVASLARAARWFLRNGHEKTLSALADRGLPRAVLWCERDSLLPIDLGYRAAEALRCELRVVRADERWADMRAPDHDWPFRAPAHFAHVVTDVLREITGDAQRTQPERPAQRARRRNGRAASQ